MQFNNSKHYIMYAKKSIVKISETKKDDSACHTDNKLSFLPRKRGIKYILSMIFYILDPFFHLNFILPKCTSLAVLVREISVCFDKKVNL